MIISPMAKGHVWVIGQNVHDYPSTGLGAPRHRSEDVQQTADYFWTKDGRWSSTWGNVLEFSEQDEAWKYIQSHQKDFG